MPPEKMTTKLREIFYRPGLTIVPGGATPYHALLTQRAGYEAFYMSGSMTSGWTLGWPDVGVTSMREMADNVGRIARAVDIPVFADIDTGYGNAVNTYRSIKEYIWAGAAGVHLEDQELPKKSGSMAGRRLISIEEALEYLEGDELLEITPLTYRLRKRVLSEKGRRRATRGTP